MTHRITLTDDLVTIHPPDANPHRDRPAITAIVQGGTLALRVNTAARRALGLDPKTSHRVNLQLSRTQIAILPAADGSRTLQSKGDVMASDLLPLFGLRDGDRLIIPVDIDSHGRLVGDQPNRAIVRNNMAALKARRAGAA